MDFRVTVLDGEQREDVALVAGPSNRYLRTALVVAFMMDRPFEIEADEQVIGRGQPGDFIVLDNGIPRAETHENFAPIHTLLPVEGDDHIERVRVAIERVIAKHVEFEDDQEAGELADVILGVLATIEVPL